MKEFRYKGHDMKVIVSSYTQNDNLFIGFEDENGELWYATTNLGIKLPKGFAFVDTNNFRDAATIIPNEGIGRFAGETAQSGYCTYPLYEFFLDRL